MGKVEFVESVVVDLVELKEFHKLWFGVIFDIECEYRIFGDFSLVDWGNIKSWVFTYQEYQSDALSILGPHPYFWDSMLPSCLYRFHIVWWETWSKWDERTISMLMGMHLKFFTCRQAKQKEIREHKQAVMLVFIMLVWKTEARTSNTDRALLTPHFPVVFMSPGSRQGVLMKDLTFSWDLLTSKTMVAWTMSEGEQMMILLVF